MKLKFHHPANRGGSALVIILVLLSVMAALILANITTLHRLKVELQLVEQKQKRAFETPAAALPKIP
jgi:hypothetical protein